MSSARNREAATGVSAQSRLRTLRTELLLFVLLLVSYAYFYQSTGTSEAVRFDQIRALVHDHTLAIDKYCFNSPDLVRYPKETGSLYPNKAPGMTFAGAIPFALFSPILSWLQMLGLPDGVFWHLLTYLTTVFTVSVISALAAVAMYRVLLKLTDDTYFSILVVLTIWLGTLIFPYSTLFFSHLLAASLLTIAFYLVFELRPESSTPRHRLLYGWSAGLLIGLSVAVEYPAALLGAVLAGYALWITWTGRGLTKRKLTEFGMFVLGGAMGGAVLVLYNVCAFGNAFYIPYEAYSTPGSAFHSTYARGWMGLNWAGVHDFLHALAGITIDRPMGLLYFVVGRWYVSACNPVLWLCLPGLLIMIWRQKSRAEGLMVGAMVIAYFVFLSDYGSSIYDRGGGLYLGPRHLIPLLPFVALPLYFGAGKLRPVFYPLAAISIFFMLLATAVEPRVSFPFGDIMRDSLLPDYLTGHLAQNTASLFDNANWTLTDDSTAANWAKIAHVPGRYQLAPLMAWWMIGAVILVSLLKPKGARFWRCAVVFLFLAAIACAPIVHHPITLPENKARGLLAKYYQNETWAGPPVSIKIDPAIDFNWSTVMPYPAPFSVEWAGQIIVDRPGFYAFTLLADDGAQLEIDGRLLIDALSPPLQEKTQSTQLPVGLHSIRVRYFNQLFGGSVKLWWTLIGRPRQIVPHQVLIPETTAKAPR